MFHRDPMSFARYQARRYDPRSRHPIVSAAAINTAAIATFQLMRDSPSWTLSQSSEIYAVVPPTLYEVRSKPETRKRAPCGLTLSCALPSALSSHQHFLLSDWESWQYPDGKES